MKIFSLVLTAVFISLFLPNPTYAQHADMQPQPAPSQSPSQMVPATPSATVSVRRNIYSLSPEEVQRLVAAINTIRANGVYDRYMQMHMEAMMTMTPLNDPISDRNAAHRGPVFLPWHRAYIWEFEQQLKALDPSVSLPYWAFEQENPNALPLVFSARYFGGDGNTVQQDRVTDSPFNWMFTRRIARDTEAEGVRTLPSQNDVNAVMQIREYDTFPFNENSQGFRTAMEGWTGTNAPWGMHNRVHRYVGGDMLPDETMSRNAVNDPIFWLVHANVDRLWWQWQQTNGVANYTPQTGGPAGHNINDVMQFLPRQGRPIDTFNIETDMRYLYN
jgi:tyrosinase